MILSVINEKITKKKQTKKHQNHTDDPLFQDISKRRTRDLKKKKSF